MYLLKTKDEAFEAFKRFRAQVERGPEKRVKSFRTDRGGEFCSNDFLAYCENSGIYRQFTAPYTPQQNDIVKRRNRTVVAITRSFLKTMKLPSFLWGEAVRHSIYVLNRLPTRALSEKTPYEVWTGMKPNLEHIRVFGCVCHMKVPSVQTTKLDDRSKLVVNLGKEPGTKAYRLLDPVSKKVFVSRDVVFQETKSWEWKQSEAQSSDISNPLIVLGFESDRTETSEGADTEMSQGETQAHDHSPIIPVSTQASSVRNSASTGESTEPRNFRLIQEIYDDTNEVELQEELMLMGVDEPINYQQASKKKEWVRAMEQELEAVE